MTRPRLHPPSSRPDRISGADLAAWLRLNDVSLHTLARELGVRYGTANNWIKGYSATPAWLEQRIRYYSAVSGRFPPYGEYRTAPEAPLPKGVL